MRSIPRLLTYNRLPYNGTGPAQSCVSILTHVPSDVLAAELVIPRVTRNVAKPVRLTQTLPWPLRYAPWKPVARLGIQTLNQRFLEAIQAADPANTIAYFWPDPPLDLIRAAKSRGILTVREMTNCFRGTAKRILDEAYREQNLPPGHTISAESVELERQELALYDHVFASNQVEATVVEAGVDPSRILPTAFGWSPDRFETSEAATTSGGLTVLFVGLVCIGKGAPQLLAAWKKSGVNGKLVLAGAVHDEMRPIVEPYRNDTSIEFVGFRRNLSSLYRQADFFVFPSFVEGGPQVVYEAAGCGLPVITTPMGSGRIIKDQVNGLVVEAGDIDGLAAAISRLAASAELRRTLSRQAKADAELYTYQRLAITRARLLSHALYNRQMPHIS